MLSSAAGLRANITFAVSSSSINAFSAEGNEVGYGRLYASGGLRYVADPYTGDQVLTTD